MSSLHTGVLSKTALGFCHSNTIQLLSIWIATLWLLYDRLRDVLYNIAVKLGEENNRLSCKKYL